MSIRDEILKKAKDEQITKQECERLEQLRKEEERKQKLDALNTIRHDQLDHVFLTLTSWLEERLKKGYIQERYPAPSIPGMSRSVNKRCVIVDFHVDILSEKTRYSPFMFYFLERSRAYWEALQERECKFDPFSDIEIRRGKLNKKLSNQPNYNYTIPKLTPESYDYGAYISKPVHPEYAHLSHTIPPYEDTDAFGILHIRHIEYIELNKRIAKWLIDNDILLANWSCQYSILSRGFFTTYNPSPVDPSTFDITNTKKLMLYL